MGAKPSKRYYSFKSQPKVFKLFLNFLHNGPHKSMFGIFQILVVTSPGPYARTYFEFLKKNFFLIFYEYFSFSLT